MTDSAQNSKQILAQKGTAGTPSHSFLGGNTTGMYLAGTNQLGFSTAGAFAAVIDASGTVGIGTASPTTKLTVQTAALTDAVRWTDNINSTAQSVEQQNIKQQQTNKKYSIDNTQSAPPATAHI
jgi:hypothetical protein